MVKKRKTQSNRVHKTLKKHISKMGWQARLVTGMAIVAVLAVSAFAVLKTAYAATYNHNEVLITDAAEARVWDVIVETEGNTIRIQFDYDLANGATQATVDAALYDQRSFGSTTVTGPGHYDATLTEIPDGSYFISIVISGNPVYFLADPGPSNQPLIISIPDSKKSQNGTPTVRYIKHYYHQQQQDF